MIHMLCRTRVTNYARWKQVFDSHADKHREAGLTLERMWRCVDEPNNIYFIFEVDDIARAEAFLHSPESADAGESSGVIDGEYHFMEDTQGY